MEKGWVKIVTYTKSVEAEIVRQMLDENGIAAVVLNKQDSSYLFGKIEIYVNEQDEETAKGLINNNIDIEEKDAN